MLGRGAGAAFNARTSARAFESPLDSVSQNFLRHEGEAREPARRFRELNPEDRKALIIFLQTL